MGLRIIYGRAGSGKSWFCLNDIKAKLDHKGESPLLLIVPEQYSLQADKNMIKALGSTGIRRADVLTFRRMAYRVFNEVGGLTRRYINSAGKCMILYKAIEGLKGELKIFGRAAEQQGFINTMLQVITEMKRYNITPELLDKTCQSMQGNGHLVSKLADIGRIYLEYRQAISEKYMDADDDLTALVQKLEASTQYNGAEIWIDEFAGFTPQEYRVIEILLRKAASVNVTLCSDCLDNPMVSDHTDVFSPVRNTARKLLKIANDNGISVESPVELIQNRNDRFKTSTELQHLERNYFSFPYIRYSGKTQDISIFTAMNIYSEVENTARDIIRLCRERGVRFRDIAVVTRNLAGYEKLISTIFSQYGIPYFMDMKRNINNHPMVMLILSALEIFHRNWSYEAVFRYLKTGLTDIGMEDIDYIENYVLACGIKGNTWTQDEKWMFRMEQNFENSELSEYELKILSRVNDIRQRVITPLLSFRSKTKGRKTTREICSALFDFLCDLGVPQRIEERVGQLKASGELGAANEYGQVWNIIMEVFDQVVEVMQDETLGLQRFSRILTIGFGEYKMGLIPAALDQVLVGSIERSKSHEVKALYILGVNDGIFPMSVMEEGILSDSDREHLRDTGLELAQDTRMKTFEEQHLIYTTITTTGGYLRFSYPIADQEGKSMRPSSIISRLKKIFPQIDESSNLTPAVGDREELELVNMPVPTFNHLVSAVRSKWEGHEINPLWWRVYQWYRLNEKWETRCKTALGGLLYTNLPDPVNPDKTRKLYGSPMIASVSRLEKFASCPFAFFAQYGLKARERKIAKFNAPDVGSFLHSVIDRVSKRIEGKELTWRNIDREWCTRTVSEIVNQLVESTGNSVLSSSKRYRYIASRLKRVLSRAVWLIAEHIRRSSFEPIGYEVGFGDNEQFPSIEIELSSGDRIKLVGRIDRVDACKTGEGTYLRIIDYKSGNKSFKLSDVYYGLQIQLLTYFDAVCEKGGAAIPKPILPGGILYFKIDDPIVRTGSSATEEDIERQIMKQLKMKGLLLADVKLVKEMDREIDGDSLIVPARINKGDVLGRSSAATAQQFELLRKHVKRLLAQLGGEILDGDVSISPYKRKNVTSCMYCSYTAVCQFDPGLKDNKFRNLMDKKDEEVWELMNRDQG